ncbi:hypothetical protein ABNF97_18395 [Plantactinospora sp. B6F1]|uniref:hypothetical protein n=1 Tax=Plantactinospora sp. B6F1 TaxID=3158971 RepID=UPI00102AACFB
MNLRTDVPSRDRTDVPPYTFVSTSWNHGPTDILVRVSLIGVNGVRLGTWVDDLGILCHT